MQVVETPAAQTIHSLTSQHRGLIFVRIRAKNGAGLSAPSNEVRAEDQRDIVEALFLSTGVLRSLVHQPICQFTSLFPDIINGFPRGTTLTVVMSSTLTEPHRTAAGKLLDDMNAATMGSLQTIRTFSDDRNYMEGTFRRNQWHGANELVILDVDDGQPFCGALGCGGGRLAAGATSALFRNAFVIVQRNAPPAILAHELGHAVGLCHCAPAIMGSSTLMGTSAVAELSVAELAAIRSLYGAGLGPGSSRQALISAGLISP